MAKKPGGGSSKIGRVLLIAVLPMVVVAVAGLLAAELFGTRFGEDEAAGVLSRGHSLQASFQQQRFERLALAVRNVARDLDFAAPPTSDEETGGPLSVLDQLLEKQEELGFDFAVALDPQGRVLVRTDGPQSASAASPEDLSGRPLVARALEESQAFGEDPPPEGIWRQGDRLSSAVAMAQVRDFEVLGGVVVGDYIDEILARELGNATAAQVAFLVAGPNVAVAGTTLSPEHAQDLIRSLRAQGSLEAVLSQVGERQVELGGETWQALLAPLNDHAGAAVGATVTLVSRSAVSAPYRWIQWVLGGVGLGALLLAVALSLTLFRSSDSPLKPLIQNLELASQGQYHQNIALGGAGAAGQMATALDRLLQGLREMGEMGAYLSTLTRSLPEPSASQAPASAQSAEVVLLSLELRRFANPRLSFDPEQTVDRLGRDLRRIRTSLTVHRGVLETVFGHRVVASFEGEGRALRALGAASEIVTQLAIRESAFDEVEPPVVALVVGECILGSLAVGESPLKAMVGLPVQQMESLMREATPGDVLLSQKAYEEVAGDLAAAGIELSPRRGLMSSQSMFLMSAEQAAQVTGGQLDSGATVPATQGAGPGDLEPGVMLAERYEILSLIDASDWTQVFKARDREMDDFVYVKVLRGEEWETYQVRERLITDIDRGSRIAHPNVTRILDSGEMEGVPFVVEECARGFTLRQILDQTGRLQVLSGLYVAKQLCAGLAEVHAQDVVHRGIQPGNLLVEFTGRAKLTSVGLTPSQLSQAAEAGQGRPYLAPEQIAGLPTDARTDVYGCGVVLYETFTGQLPFAQEALSTGELAAPDSLAGLPQGLDQIILKCLQENPEGRYPGAAALRADLAGVRYTAL